MALAGLLAAARATPDLFGRLSPSGPAETRSRLGRAVDRVHRRFGRGSLVFGPAPLDREAYAGNKLAFSRMPPVSDDDGGGAVPAR